MSDKVTDLTFRTDLTGNMILGRRGEYVCNIAQMLFTMVPGYDEYAPEKGLDIARRKVRAYVQNTRDSAYESMIIKQFTTYTDLIPLQVIAMYLNESLHVYMMIRYLDGIYEMDIDSNTLNAMLRSAAQSTPGIPTPPIS